MHGVPVHTRNKLGVRGVHRYKDVYRVRIIIDNCVIELGHARTLIDAVRRRHAGELKYRPGKPLSEVNLSGK